MEVKKSIKANLENNRIIFIQVGMVIILAIILLAFEWRSYDKRISGLGPMQAEAVIEEVVMNTQQEQKPPPPQQEQSFEFKIVEDDIDIEDNFEIDAEADQNTQIEEYIAPDNSEVEVEEAEIFLVVEEQPEYPGGEEARKQFLKDNINYPQIARESGIEGTVYINFVVEPDGSISNIVVRRGIGGGCDEEAQRVVKIMPRWKAGKQRGKPVRVSFNMPIKFTLN